MLRALPAQPTAGLSNIMLLAYRLLCSQARSCAEVPAAGELIIGTYFAVLKFAMKDIVGRCAAGRGRPCGELRGELGRGRQPRARGMWPATPKATAEEACARPRTMCMRMLGLYSTEYSDLRRVRQQRQNPAVPSTPMRPHDCASYISPS